MAILRLIVLTLLATPVISRAQPRPVSGQDSALVGRILLAEDRRDSTDAALAEGIASGEARINVLARRARARIRDPRFASRDSFPALPAPPVYPVPAWQLRLRALTAQKNDCTAMRTALADSAWQVRLRAADLLTTPCAPDAAIVTTLREWVDGLAVNTTRRIAGGVSWHAAAHAIVALARLSPEDARSRMQRLATSRQWQLRAYAARASAVLADTMRLRAFVRDADDNVKEAAIDGLSKVAGHAEDNTYLAALNGQGAQAVRAAAIALKGSPREDVKSAANTAYGRWAARGIASARDTRVALLEAAGRPATDEHDARPRGELLPDAIALALGEDIRLKVSMAPTSGGGTFIVHLRGDVAPLMASRILALVRAGYYDGLTWHRIEPDFVIQGGSPGASEATIRAMHSGSST